MNEIPETSCSHTKCDIFVFVYHHWINTTTGVLLVPRVKNPPTNLLTAVEGYSKNTLIVLN